MAWHSSQKKTSGRFDLLLLEEGEYFFEDYSAVRCTLPRYHTRSPQQGALANLRQVRGRIKVCSRGLMFDPEDTTIPVSSYSFKSMAAACPTAFSRESDASSPGLGSQMFVISCKSITHMREDGVHHPYRFVTPSPQAPGGPGAGGGGGRVNQDEPAFVFLFSLLHTQLEKLMPLVSRLWDISQQVQGRGFSAEAELLAPLLRQRHLDKFDSSLLVDFSEKPLLRGALLVTRIVPLVRFPGCLFVTSKRVYFQPAPLNNVGDPVVRFRLRDIKEMHRRRYLLRQCGLEIFFRENNSHRGAPKSLYLSFNNSEERDYVYKIIASQDSVTCVQPVGSGDGSSRLLQMQGQWQRREISNYEYLTFLNNEADRSRNDLTQYPVFPWVVSDYTSRELNLDDVASFRDLSKPIGALNPERLRDFKERFANMPPGDKEMGIPPPFLYGTHYSVPGYVLFYVVRYAPEYMLRLQNGKFDAPDRLFNSISETWESVLSNPADLKELIPEFYDTSGSGMAGSASPGDFLMNNLDLDMGIRQKNQKRVHDVELPPWANGSPRVFVEKMRAALESEHVSRNIHKWIDLIFGSKQKGSAAKEADNLFYWLTYEGAVDLDSNDLDPVQKQSYEVQIGEFGQCPKQLFTVDHPRRDEIVGSDSVNSLQPIDNKTFTAEDKMLTMEKDSDKSDAAALATAVKPSVVASASLAMPDEDDVTKAAIKEAMDKWHKRQTIEADEADAKAMHKAKSEADLEKDGKDKPADTGGTIPTLADEPKKGSDNRTINRLDGAEAKSAKVETVTSSSPAASTPVGRQSTSSAEAQHPSVSISAKSSKTISLYSVVASFPEHLQSGALPSVRKKIHRSAITAMCIGNSLPSAEQASVGISGSSEGRSGMNTNASQSASLQSRMNSLSSAKMLLYSTSEDTSLKLHTWGRNSKRVGVDASDWAQRRSVQLNSLSLSSCVLRQMANESVKAAVVGSWDNHIYVYSVECGRMQQQLIAHDDAVACLAQSQTHLASGSWDSTVKLWQWTPQGLSRDPLFTVFDHDTQVNCVAMVNAHGEDSSASHNLVLSGGENGTVALHDSRDGGAAAMICDADAPVGSLCWGKNGDSFIVCSASPEGDYGVLQVHDIRMNWGCVYATDMDYPGRCMCVVDSQRTDSSLIVTGCADGRARCFEVGATEMLPKWEVDIVHNSSEAITAIAATTSANSGAGHIAFGTAQGNSIVFGK